MRTFPLSLLLAGCAPGIGLVVDKAPFLETGAVEGDTDTDTDADADTDADTDTDPSGDTGTGHTGAPVVEPAADHYVDCTGQGDFLTIQAAIDAAVSGQSIGVRPCTYVERLQLKGKALELFGTQGSAVTVIDGNSDGTVLNVEEGESDGTRIAGFTIRNGDDNDGGSGLEVYRATVELQDVVFTENDRSQNVIWSVGGFLRLIDVTLEGNEVAGDGYAIDSDDGGGLTAKNLTVDCDGGAAAVRHHNTLILADSDIRCDSGVGVLDYHGEDRIVRSVISGGDAGIRAYDVENTPDLLVPDLPNELFLLSNSVVVGGVVGADVLYMYAEIDNCVLSGGEAAVSFTAMREDTWVHNTGLVSSRCGLRADFDYDEDDNGYWDLDQQGCGIAVRPDEDGDPLFVAFPDDVHLQAGSPWIDRGANDEDVLDVDGTRNDIGAYGGPLGYW